MGEGEGPGSSWACPRVSSMEEVVSSFFVPELWFSCLAKVASTSTAEAPTGFAPRLSPLQLAMESSSPSPSAQDGLPFL
uniref:Uncharacterized protein n=1 Tax=Oryza barthii TaxID=65489 RepID=A0A0D3H937_9ORYZ